MSPFCCRNASADDAPTAAGAIIIAASVIMEADKRSFLAIVAALSVLRLPPCFYGSSMGIIPQLSRNYDKGLSTVSYYQKTLALFKNKANLPVRI
jgi:hypothetical protein